MNKLDEICATKRDEVAARKTQFSLNTLAERCVAQSQPRGFRERLDRCAKDGFGLIAEIKRASPSKGLIRKDFDPQKHAIAYENGGAACLSVLTDERYFQGHDSFLATARGACTLPVLRKDFMIDPWQVFEARSLGADAILIIMAAVDDGLAHELEATALALGMDVLVETHNLPEFERALRLQSRLIGVNNRNLKDFTVDFSRTYELVHEAPEGCTFVAESGLRDYRDLQDMAAHGVRCFLVGESLMREDDLTLATRRLLTGR